MADKVWTPATNQERAVAEALKDSGILAIPLTAADLRGAIAAIDGATTVTAMRPILKRLLKALAILWIELERRT